MSGEFLRELFKKDSFKRRLVFIISFLFIYGVLATSLVTKKYSLKEGEIARVNIKAPREVKDESMTEARIKQSIEAVPPQYNKRIEVKIKAIDDVNGLLSKAIQLSGQGIQDKDKLVKLKEAPTVDLSNEDLITLSKLPKEDLSSLQTVLTDTLNIVFDNNIMEDNREDIKKAQETILLNFNSSKLSKTVRDLGITIGYATVKPNLYYDKERTEELKVEASKKVPPVMIKKDQIIVKEGESVTRHQMDILKDLGLISETKKSDWYIYFALGVLIFLILLIEWFYLYKFYKNIYDDWSKLSLISIINIISLILARTLGMISPFLIPLACGPMLLTLLLEDKISLTISVINCILISVAVGFNIETTLLALLNSVLGAIILKKMQQRNDILYSSLYLALVNTAFTFIIGFLLSNNVFEIFKKTGFSLIASIVSAILTIGFLPFFESTFDIVTTIKLLELSNPNNLLLKRLLIEAPGTYHHSVLVANLAEFATEQIGGNAVLARVASYYHDVGKIKRPYFFKENQLGNDNPHNKITPNLSTLIITSHVKDGLELAKEYKLPKVIQDIIEQHHGTSLVKYFYVTMKNTSEKPEEVKEEDFKYGGPIPFSKEAGVIMLADGVEASVRSISEPTKGKIEEMVNNIIKNRLNEGQLDNCDLTLKDLDKIRKAFLKSLSGIYHERIEYPEDKWQTTLTKEN